MPIPTCIPSLGRLRLLAATLLILLAALEPAAAQSPSTGSTARRRQGPEKEFRRFTLSNGLEVIVVENHLVPLATIELGVRNGSFTEGPEYAGLSHLYEHMFFKANASYSSSEAFMGELSRLGILYNATTREEVVYYYFTLPVENLEKGMKLMGNTVQSPVFDPVELEREREVVLGEFDRQESSPFFEFSRAMDVAMWGDHVTRVLVEALHSHRLIWLRMISLVGS